MYVVDIRFASLGLGCCWCWEISVFFFFFVSWLGLYAASAWELENAPRLARGHIHSKAHGGSASMVGLTQ